MSPLPTVRVKLNDTVTENALIDSGSSVCLINEDMLSKLLKRRKINVQPSEVNC